MSAHPRTSVVDPAGPQAARIDELWDLFLGVSVVVALLVVAVETIVVVRALRRRRHDGDGDPLSVDDRQLRRLAIVIGAAVFATVVTLGVLLVASIETGDRLADLARRAGALRIKIVAHQWWWHVEYEDPLPSRRAVTANEIRVPVGRPVELELTSGDVIHSFWVPNLHGKKDLIPGRTNRTWLEATEAGVYRGQCAEFCGHQHAGMELLVIAEPADAFDRWLDRQREPARSPTTRQEMRGRELFLTGPCALCHSIRGTPAGGILGPDLTHVASRTTLAAGAVPNTRGHLAGWIADPQRIKPGVRMPSYLVHPDDLHALLAYLELLQ